MDPLIPFIIHSFLRYISWFLYGASKLVRQEKQMIAPSYPEVRSCFREYKMCDRKLTVTSTVILSRNWGIMLFKKRKKEPWNLIRESIRHVSVCANLCKGKIQEKNTGLLLCIFCRGKENLECEPCPDPRVGIHPSVHTTDGVCVNKLGKNCRMHLRGMDWRHGLRGAGWYMRKVISPMLAVTCSLSRA